MKKFLFTLAALMMMGTAYADDYLYIEDFEVAQAELGTTLTLPVAAHYDYAVSAWELWIEVPEGMEISYCEQGADMTISYLKANGRAGTLQAPLYFQENGHYITAIADPGYNEDKTTYGCVKWLAGDYEEMLLLDIDVAADFKGGEIKVITEPSCTPDSREGVEPCPQNHYEMVCNVTVEGGEQPAEPAPVPTLTWSEDSYTMEATCEGHDVVLMINGEAVENPYTVKQTYEAQTITFVAYTVANADESGNSANVEQTVTVPAKAKTPSNKPSVVVTPGDNDYTIEAVGTGEVKLYVNGAEVESPYHIARPAYGEADITVTAYATNLDSDPEGEIQYEIATSDTKDVIVPAKDPEYYQTPDPVITVDVNNEAEIVTITATGEGTVTLKVTGINGTVGEASGEGSCSVVVPFGEAVDYVNAYATATAAGEFVYPGDATETAIVIPAKAPVVPEQTDKPVITWEEVEGGVNVTATGNGHICLYVEDELVKEGEGTVTYFIASTEMEEEYGVSATAKEEDKLVSDPAVETVYVPGLVPEDTTLDGEIIFGEVNQENGQFTVTYTGDENVTITLNRDDITLVRGTANTYKLPEYGTYEVTATVRGEGYDPISKDATLVWNAPVVPEKPVAPTITVDTDPSFVTLGATQVEGATVVFYQCDDAEGTNPREITNPTIFQREAQNYTVYVYAVATNAAGSTSTVVTSVVIPAKEQEPDPTSINEMNAGKTVAAVRYFNMAGQEMQEANGMTIVVTTYTDGTTSAVKVMK